jgi:hypothetical protein
MFMRAHSLWQTWTGIRSSLGFAPAVSSGGAGQRSEVETAFLRMSLDHETGLMEGRILRGRFYGRSLADLVLSELLDLCQEVKAADEPSVALVEAYLDRRFPEWRETATGAGAGRAQSAASSPGLSREEALEILGLSPGATPEEVNAAHHRLMQRVHPDVGGSDWLAARLNQARDLLLKG